MNRFVAILLFLLAVTVQSALAQYNTGSNELNKDLVKLDAEASLNFGAFKADLSGSYNISSNKIDYLSTTVGMSAGDIYMTVRIAKIISVEIDQVVDVYKVHHKKGWGAMAKELGIKPGSPEFHALKGTPNKKAHGPKNHHKSKAKKG